MVGSITALGGKPPKGLVLLREGITAVKFLVSIPKNDMPTFLTTIYPFFKETPVGPALDLDINTFFTPNPAKPGAYLAILVKHIRTAGGLDTNKRPLNFYHLAKGSNDDNINMYFEVKKTFNKLEGPANNQKSIPKQVDVALFKKQLIQFSEDNGLGYDEADESLANKTILEIVPHEIAKFMKGGVLDIIQRLNVSKLKFKKTVAKPKE